tara:strand:+ start:2481 stop:3695 length:1215 start_codon:yes stop_codon:yes gene_type:complete
VTIVIRSNEVRRGNRGLVLSAVRRGGLVSRTDIGRQTGLSAATVSAITSDLIADGFLIQPSQTLSSGSGRGRPKVALTVNPAAALIGVVIFQLNLVSAAIVDYSGATISESSRQLTSAELTPQDIRDALVGCLKNAMDRSGYDDRLLSRIAVSVQGVTDVAGSVLLWSPITEHRDLPLAGWMRRAFSVPTSVSNDCDLMARALNRREPKRYSTSFASIMLSYGVGMGLFLRGTIVNGLNTSGTEFGHMVFQPGGALCRCGRRGCIEAYAADYAIRRAARGEPEDTMPPAPADHIDFQQIADLAHAGDARAIQAIEEAGRAIGTGLCSLFALVDAFPIALIGRGTLVFDIMEGAIREALESTVGGGNINDIDIHCFADEKPLVAEGCAITALLVLDEEIADAAVV